MKYILTFLFIMSFKFSYSQDKKFKEIEDKIKSQISNNQWDDVLLTAPDLIVEAPTQGDGFYYTAYAFLMLKDISKAKEYLIQAELLADEKLKGKINTLKTQIEVAGGANQLLDNARKLQNNGNSKKAADEWKKLWEVDKTKTEFALNAVELYVEGKYYPDALEILGDDALKYDRNALLLFQKVNQTPEMNKINGYNEAMKAGNEFMTKSLFQAAIAKFTVALGFNPKNAEALKMKAEAEDENAWKNAKSTNTIPSFEQYLSRSAAKKYASNAISTIKNSLVFYGEKAAKENNVSNMEYYLNKYLKDYPNGEDVQKIKRIFCDNYIRIANESAKLKSEYSQGSAVENYTKAKAFCFQNSFLDKRIKNSQKLQTRYGRADRFFISYLYDDAVPYGLTTGTLNNTSVGFFILGRINEAMYNSASSFTVDNMGKPSGETGSYAFTGSKTTGTSEFEIGLTKKVTFPLWLYAGGGVSFNQEQWEFKSSSNDILWVKNTDNKTTKAIFDAGVIVDVGGFNIRGGGKTSDFSKIDYSIGIGFSF